MSLLPLSVVFGLLATISGFCAVPAWTAYYRKEIKSKLVITLIMSFIICSIISGILGGIVAEDKQRKELEQVKRELENCKNK